MNTETTVKVVSISEPITPSSILPTLTKFSYSREESASILGISVRMLDSYLSRGILEKRQRGRRVVIPVESLWAALHSDQTPSQLAA
jgi:hypothetical protein